MGVGEQTFLAALVDVLEVEVLGQVYRQNLHVGVSECLTQADAHTTVEWGKTARVALLAARCQTELA